MTSPCFFPPPAAYHAYAVLLHDSEFSVFDNYIMCPISAVQMLACLRISQWEFTDFFVFLLFSHLSKTYKNWIIFLWIGRKHIVVPLLSLVISGFNNLKQLWYILGSLSYQRLYGHNLCACKKSPLSDLWGVLFNKSGFVLAFWEFASGSRVLSVGVQA